MGKRREAVRRVEVVCKVCSAEYIGEVVMVSRSVPGVMGPVGEMMKRAVDNCPECGSYAVRLKS